MLRASGIKVWICTGDKYETTLEVVKACNLTGGKLDTQIKLLDEKLEDVGKILYSTVKMILEKSSFPIDILVVSAPAFAIIRSDEKLEKTFLQILTHATSTIFVRMSPSQKSQVIDVAKTKLKMKIMAIGDGYNDTQMLEAADCGIRIRKPVSTAPGLAAIQKKAV